MFAGKKSAQIREILISESAWEEMTCLFAPSLVDDHELVRAGIRRILEDIKGIKVAGEACCGEDAVKWCRANSADVVLMDMNMRDRWS